MKRNAARRRLDRFFTLCAYAAVAVMAFFLLLVVAPVFVNGAGAYVFRGTVEFRKMMLDQFGRGDTTAVKAEAVRAERARQPVYEALARFDAELEGRTGAEARQLRKAGREVRGLLAELLGPLPGDTPPTMTRSRYGKTRWNQARKALDKLLYAETWDYSGEAGVKVRAPRAPQFEGTALAPVFALLENDPDLARRYLDRAPAIEVHTPQRLDRGISPRLVLAGGKPGGLRHGRSRGPSPRRNPRAPAPVPVPDRRSSRSGPAPGHGRNRASHIRAGAGNA